MVMPRRHEAGYSMVFWAVILALVFVPLMALAWDVSRLMYVRGELQKAADAAAEAAARQVDIAHYRQTGETLLRPEAVQEACYVAYLNTRYLRARGYNPWVTHILVDQGSRTVRVGLAARMHILIPSITPPVTVHAEGVAQARMR